MIRKLDAREYKLLLDPRIFGPKPTLPSANEFWATRLQSLVQVADPNSSQFTEASYRVIQFWDTQNCDLTKRQLILRSREDASDAFALEGKCRVTLKFRMPDQFIVGTAELDHGDQSETDFEEDIGPLEILEKKPGQEARVVIPSKLSTRNRFSLSTTIGGASSIRPNNLDEVFLLFPGADKIVKPSAPPSSLPMVGGPVIYEYAFRGCEVRHDDSKAKLTLSLWCFGDHAKQPDVAELSFKCKTPDGRMSGRAARAAHGLFISFQQNLSSIIDSDHTSKTSLSLPPPCGG